MAKKGRENTERSMDPAAQAILIRADMLGIGTAFTRAENMAPCNIGSGKSGMCCKNCFMGPCRITKDGQVGVCGATLETIAARNMARSIASGAAAHSDHGRDLAFTLEAVAKGEAPGYKIRDTAKLWDVAHRVGIPTEGRPVNDVALDIARKALGEFGQQRGELVYLKNAPAKRYALWKKLDLSPRGIDREVVDTLHRTHMGDDQDPAHILKGAIRTALSDGWGGSMWATDISDILFGTPSPKVSQVNLGVLKTDEVNIIVHGHEPTLSEMIVAAVQDPELIDYAKSKGANGICLAGICCTSNEVMMRQGIPSAGNFLHQELAILTGAVEAMVVDVQCIMQALPNLADNFHTKIITTSPKVKITGALHMEFDEHKAMQVAKDIVRLAIDNYPNRGEIMIPDEKEDVVPGFSHEYLNYMLGGSYRGSFRPLNDAIMSGRIRGAAAVVGCNNPRTTQDKEHIDITLELLKNDVLVVQTGCGAIAAGKYGLLLGEAAMSMAGPGLREVCEAIGIPPVLHMEFDEHHAMQVAKDIVRLAIDNYPNRGEILIPDEKEDVVPGFSHEYLNYMLGGSYRGSFRPLNDAIMSGRIRGAAAVVGCNNPRSTQDKEHFDITTELLKNDVLVVQTGCGAIAAGKYGMLLGEAAMSLAGPGLREVCEAIGIPPVLHMGSCVDNSRILTVLTQMATEGGLGEDISDLPAVGIAPEWMSEKALAIGTYAAASGAYVLFGVDSPIEFSEEVTSLMSEGWEEMMGGKMEFVHEPMEIVRRSLDHIDKKRAALKLPVYDATKYGQSGDYPIQDYLDLPVEEQQAMMYGVPA